MQVRSGALHAALDHAGAVASSNSAGPDGRGPTSPNGHGRRTRASRGHAISRTRRVAWLTPCPAALGSSSLSSRRRSATPSALAYFLSQQADIAACAVSTAHVESLIVKYDPEVWDADSLVTLIKAYDPDPAALQRWQSAEYEPACG